MYQSKLDLMETERAIKQIKDVFERRFADKMNLIRVSAPLFLERMTGLNDHLSGVETPVMFTHESKDLEIVQSLAKWKRLALYRYGFKEGSGLYTDMNAIRKDETLSPIHSLYVDQWDWEKVMTANQRHMDFLRDTVKDIFTVFKIVDREVADSWPGFTPKLPDKITFISSQELEDLYPEMSPKEREHAITEKHKAVFITQIGGILQSGKPHDGRSPDYDDWTLNGDILFWHEAMGIALELSSMGIRVDQVALEKQLTAANALDRKAYSYHQWVLEGSLPLSIGGGIGQSRMCQFFLEKKHIGEVQSSYWPDEIVEACEADNIFLL